MRQAEQPGAASPWSLAGRSRSDSFGPRPAAAAAWGQVARALRGLPERRTHRPTAAPPRSADRCRSGRADRGAERAVAAGAGPHRRRDRRVAADRSSRRDGGTWADRLRPAFRKAVGEPVHRYVVRRRANRARLMLLSESCPRAVALETGFSHQTHMARWLRRFFGMAPSELETQRRRTLDRAFAPLSPAARQEVLGARPLFPVGFGVWALRVGGVLSHGRHGRRGRSCAAMDRAA